MKCEDFIFSVRDLARALNGSARLNADLRHAALAHAQRCVACAARLADERRLSEGLTALAASEQSLQPSPTVETALLAAFRQQQQTAAAVRQPVAAATEAATPAPVLPFSPAQRTVQPPARRHAVWRWSLAAAAVLGCALAVWVWRIASAERTSASSTNAAKQLAVQASPTPENLVKPAATTAGAKPIRPQTAAYVATATPHQPKRNGRRAPRYRIERYLVESEIVTDFLPLTDTATWPRNTTLQTVRVEVPRTLLTRFGLPLSVERADEVVKADLLVGPDGLTRAIRFVQSEFQEPQIITAHNASVREP